jgi:hypothetical protein
MKPLQRWASMAAVLLACAAPNAVAATRVYTQPADFQAATLGWLTSLTDFDSLAAGSALSGGAGFMLSVDAGGLNAVVADRFWTSSGSNYLGLDGGDGQFIQGDRLSFSLATGVRAFGLSVIGGADLRDFADVAVRLSGSGFQVDTGSAPFAQDGAGSFAFFVGVVSDSPLDSVTLSGFSPGFMQYAVDDLRVAVVPEAPALWLFGAGLAALLCRRNRSAMPTDGGQT